MVKRVEWTDDAILEFKTGYEYYKVYSSRLAEKFRIAILQNVDLIAFNPAFGILTSIDHVRCKTIMKRFSLIYFYNAFDDVISILRIWDNRRNPKSKFQDL